MNQRMERMSATEKQFFGGETLEQEKRGPRPTIEMPPAPPQRTIEDLTAELAQRERELKHLQGDVWSEQAAKINALEKEITQREEESLGALPPPPESSKGDHLLRELSPKEYEARKADESVARRHAFEQASEHGKMSGETTFAPTAIAAAPSVEKIKTEEAKASAASSESWFGRMTRGLKDWFAPITENWRREDIATRAKAKTDEFHVRQKEKSIAVRGEKQKEDEAQAAK